MGWLRGLPRGELRAEGLPWLSLPEPGGGGARRLIVDAETVGRAQRYVRCSAQRSRVERRRNRRLRVQLDTLARVLDGGSQPTLDELAPEAAEVVSGRWRGDPQLRAFARALAWLNLGAPDRRRRLEQLERDPEPFLALLRPSAGSPRLRAALALSDLCATQGAALEPMLALLRAEKRGVSLADPRPTLAVLGSWLEEPREQRGKPPRLPNLLDAAAQSLLQLHTLPRPERTRAASALRTLIPEADLARRERYWRRCRELQGRANADPRSPGSPELHVSFLQLAKRAPDAYLDPRAFQLARRLSQLDAGAELIRRLDDVAFPDRLAWATLWGDRLSGPSRDVAAQALPHVFDLVHEGHRTGASDALTRAVDPLLWPGAELLPRNLATLRAYLRGGQRGSVSSPRVPPYVLWRACLLEAERRSSAASEWGQLLVELSVAFPKAWEEVESIGTAGVELAVFVAGPAARLLAQLLDRLAEADLPADDLEALGALARVLERIRDPVQLQTVFLAEPLQRLVRLGRCVLGASALGAGPPQTALPAPLPSPPSWISAYPRELTSDLLELCRVVTRPEAVAARVLRRELPNPPRLRGEIATLRNLVRAGGDRRGRYQRLRSLEARLNERGDPSPTKLARCRRLLQERIARAHLERVEGLLEDHFHRALEREVPRVPGAWLVDRKLGRVLLHLPLIGEARLRPVAYRLLRARLGPKPWDLRDEPAQRRFLERMRARGLRIEAWLDGIPTQVRVAADGRVVSLSLEDDPLEILRMGERFDTCLAPGDVNFFSAISNAADLNKRVLHARDLEGRIVGRALLALSDEGGLLAYHPYAHEAALGFDLLAAGFVRELAAELKTRPAACGRVSLLLADEWYDDGPVDLCETRAFLRDPESPFRRALPTLDPVDLPRSLRRACRGEPTPEVVAEVLTTGALQERPALALGLLPFQRGLGAEARLLLARMTRLGGYPEACPEIVRSLVRRRGLAPALREALLRELEERGWYGLIGRVRGAAPETRARAKLAARGAISRAEGCT